VSKLIVELGLSVCQFNKLVAAKRPKMRKALKKVVFDGMKYEDAANLCGVTKQAIYDHLKRMKETS